MKKCLIPASCTTRQRERSLRHLPWRAVPGSNPRVVGEETAHLPWRAVPGSSGLGTPELHGLLDPPRSDGLIFNL